MTDINISLSAEELFTIGNFPVTNAFFSMIIISIVLVIAFAVIARRLTTVPGKGQLFIEAFVEGVYNFVHGVTKNEKTSRRLFPMFAVMAIFFLVSNVIGIIPGFGAITVDGVSLWRPPTADYSMVFGITIVMFFVWQFVAIISGGLVNYGKQFINFSGFSEGILNGFITFAMGLLDIIGEIAKIISLSFRLFGNIFAGEAIAAVLFGLAPYIVPIPFAMLGLLSGVIQAFVFPILVLIFITMSMATGQDGQQDREAQEASA